MKSNDLPTRDEAQERCDWLTEIKSDRCGPECDGHLDYGLAEERVLVAYASGRLIDGQAIADAWNNGESIIHDVLQDIVRGALPELAGLLDALTEEN